MTETSAVLMWGVVLAILSGVMNGTFTLPMRYLGRWSWENVWALFIIVSCLLMPVGIAAMTVSHFSGSLANAPTHTILAAVISGFAWGFGAIMFGQGVSAMGISMGNTLVLAISASMGSFLPILVLAPEQLLRKQGKAIILGTVIAFIGIVCCGYAGRLKERSEKDRESQVRGEMVGHARPFWVGFLLCAGSGILSAVFNIGYSSAQGILESAIRFGNSPFAGSNLVWLLMLTGGAVANLAFCAYLFKKNRSFSKYYKPASLPLYGLTILMGLLWGGSIFVYGSAAPKLGRLGPAIGWPLSLTVGLFTANLCGIFAGEWRLSKLAERAWMAAGLTILVVAIVTLGCSSTLS